MMVQRDHHSEHLFHGQKEIARYRIEDAPGFYTNPLAGSVYCDLFTCFLYLTDVRPRPVAAACLFGFLDNPQIFRRQVDEGDGGLCVIPGSHHSVNTRAIRYESR